MYQPGLMRALQGRRDLLDDVDGAPGVQGPGGQQRLQVTPLMSRMVTYSRPSSSPTS